ncbi:MAG: hypothetical protein AAGI52_13485 [Bacteroidota bacterium]
MDFDRMDKTAFSIVYSHEEAAEQDRQFWWSQTPSDRMAALEHLRRTFHGRSYTLSGLRGPVEHVRREGG